MIRGLIALLFGLGLLSGCGTATFSNAFSVAVSSAQDVSVFDSQMGQSAQWAAESMGPAQPGSPYTTEVSSVDTKMVFDSSPPSSLRVGVYLPGRTDTGYYSLILPQVAPGTVDVQLPFVPWYSPEPVDPQDPLPVTLQIAEGPNGWVVNLTVKDAT